MATAKSMSQGQALWRLEALRCPAYESALLQVRASPDPESVLAELEPACLEYVELALLTTLTVSIHAARKNGHSPESIEARAQTLPEPLLDRLREMVGEDWSERRS